MQDHEHTEHEREQAPPFEKLLKKYRKYHQRHVLGELRKREFARTRGEERRYSVRRSIRRLKKQERLEAKHQADLKRNLRGN